MAWADHPSFSNFFGFIDVMSNVVTFYWNELWSGTQKVLIDKIAPLTFFEVFCLICNGCLICFCVFIILSCVYDSK